MPRNTQQHAYLFTSYHYAVHASYHTKHATVELFEREADALKCARFLLYNSKAVAVYALNGSHCFAGRDIYRSAETHKKLIKIKDGTGTAEPFNIRENIA